MSALDETWGLTKHATFVRVVSAESDNPVRAYIHVGAATHGALIAAAPELYRALLAAEWGAENCAGTRSCPVCEGWEETDRHKPDCIVAAALKKARGE